jgi:hypothetical protein
VAQARRLSTHELATALAGAGSGSGSSPWAAAALQVTHLASRGAGPAMWERVGGVLCPGLESLPRLRVCGTPRDRPSAVECVPMMPTHLSAAWLTRVLYAGGHMGPRSANPRSHTAIVHDIQSCTDISGDATVYRLTVTYGEHSRRPDSVASVCCLTSLALAGRSRCSCAASGVARGGQMSEQVMKEARLPRSFILKLYDSPPTTTARSNHQSVLMSPSRAPTPAHVPICFWSCLDVRPPPSRSVRPAQVLRRRRRRLLLLLMMMMMMMVVVIVAGLLRWVTAAAAAAAAAAYACVRSLLPGASWSRGCARGTSRSGSGCKTRAGAPWTRRSSCAKPQMRSRCPAAPPCPGPAAVGR